MNEWMKKGNDCTFMRVDRNKNSHSNTAEAQEIPKVALTSYPRSGNTMIRKYLEKLTNIYTGSDCDLKRRLNK